MRRPPQSRHGRFPMRWAEWILRQGPPSTHSARRKARLAIQPLEDRTVPHVTGAEHVDHPADPASDVAVVKSETPPTSTDATIDRKSTRLNSSHLGISYAVFCLKKKNNNRERQSA